MPNLTTHEDEVACLKRQLDPASLDPSALSMGTLMRELNLRRQPSAILRKLMNALESQRIARKLGWSRPWNKEGMTIFHSLRLRPSETGFALDETLCALLVSLSESPLYRDFVLELMNDPNLMTFVFCHNHRRDGDLHEGLTLSLGRRVANDTSKRDRIDIILEDRKGDSGVDGFVDRVRIYVNPWFDHRYDRMFTSQFTTESRALPQIWQKLYEAGLGIYARLKEAPENQFEHWSIRYIDYFGPRDLIPPGSRFL
jgi:hypothetical protein